MSKKFTELLRESKEEYCELFEENIILPFQCLFLPKTLWENFKDTSWGSVLYEVLNRQISPLFESPKIVLYLLVFILLIGGIGPWSSLIGVYFSKSQNYCEFFQSLATFSLSLIATSIGEMILLKFKRESTTAKTDDSINYQDVHFLYFCIAIIASILCTIGVLNDKCNIPADYSIDASFWGTVLAIFLWWQINSLDLKWQSTKSAYNIIQKHPQINTIPNSNTSSIPTRSLQI